MIVWLIDNLKVTHFLDEVVTRMINWLKKCYEKIFPDGSGKMNVSRGKVHDYLGMMLDFSSPWRGEGHNASVRQGHDQRNQQI